VASALEQHLALALEDDAVVLLDAPVLEADDAGVAAVCPRVSRACV
jgi:hypothetical protein